MKNKNIILSAFLVGAAATWGCSGSSGSRGSSSEAGSAPVLSKGVITAFGSVFVNGVEFNTTGAGITRDGTSASESDLRLGMVVTVNGTSDGTKGTATSIDFRDNLEGAINSIDVANNTLVVMGQTVKVNSSTRYDGTQGINSLVVGNIVEVSGLPDSTGVIVATHIEFKAEAFTAGMEVELKGVISNLDTANKTFVLGILTVNYSGATLDDLGSGLSNGMSVEVKSTQAITGGVMVASAVEKTSSGVSGQTGTHVEIEGLVTDFMSGHIMVDGQPVQTTSNTVYENGTAANIALNVKVEVRGTLDTSGMLAADKVSFKN